MAWNPALPWVKYDGTNGEEIRSVLDEKIFGDTQLNNEGPSHIQINNQYSGPSLSLNQVYGDGQVRADTWHIPVGYWFNPETGEVRDDSGTAIDWDTLVQMG